MSYIFVITGVRGSGKTTLVESLKTTKGIKVLKPCTTRVKRHQNDNEYNFYKETNWPLERKLAWQISVHDKKYGMEKSELQSINKFGVTVFDPAHIEVANNFKKNSRYKMITIGLDTVESIDIQKERVSSDGDRMQSQRDFELCRGNVLNSDVVLRGGVEELKSAIIEMAKVLQSRGGVLTERTIRNLIEAGSLVSPADGKISPASYDLNLGEDVWCQGKKILLNDDNPTLKIPPYSYAIVSAKEQANLPSFIIARFDLKNSLFFRGAILSNGPQIDPGYRGALFCMIYNGSDTPIGIKRNEHFATIEFLTTASLDSGYRASYQGKTKLEQFMPSDTQVSEGGKILERTEEKIGKLEAAWDKFRGTFGLALVGAIALLLAPSISLFIMVFNESEELLESYNSKVKQFESMQERIVELERRIELRELPPSKN
jgi:deoxycytidine triphosphate deaminase/guanylate kinase